MYFSLYIVEISFSLCALISNIFLIFLALKIDYKGKEIRLIIALASSEVFVVTCFQADFIYYLIEGVSLISKELPCQILGYIASTLFYFEVMLKILLTMERYYKINQKKLPKYFFIPLHINTVFCLGSIVWVSYSKLFEPAPGGLVCMASLHRNIFSAFIYFYFVGGFAVGMLTISVYYYKLAGTIGHIQEITNRRIEDGSRSSRSIDYQTFSNARIKLYIIIGIYGSLMFLSGSLLVIGEALTFYVKKDSESVVLINQFAHLFGIMGLLANPIILLSLHTGITKEFKKLISSVSSRTVALIFTNP